MLSTDIRFRIVTSNADLGEETPYLNLQFNTWTKTERAEVMYLDKDHRSYAFIRKIIAETSFDVLYINSFFSFRFSILPLYAAKRLHLNRKIVIAPRGMLGAGALTIKPFKKQIYLKFCNLMRVYNGIVWHATGENERQEIQRNIKNAENIQVVANLPKQLPPAKASEKIRDRLNLFFLSRISRKKQLHFALDVLKKSSVGNIRFSIYGPVEDETYWKHCENLIKALPPNIETSYRGVLSPEEIPGALADEHVMILPTLNENFGHSIAESLYCGRPVIISDQTPWNDLSEHKAGFAIALGAPEDFQKAIVHYLNMDKKEFDQSIVNCVQYISKKIDLPAIKSKYIHLFQKWSH